MRVGDEEYRRKLRRYNTLLLLEKATIKQDLELVQLDRELTAAELRGRGLRGVVEDYERALELGDMGGIEG